MTLDEIKHSVIDFVSGRDTTVTQANRIEVALDEAYPDDDFIQEKVEILARYRPGGGEFLYDTPDVIPHLNEVLSYLDTVGRSSTLDKNEMK